VLTTETTLTPQVHALRARLTGELVLRSDPNWDDARRAWNLAVDQRPAAVAFPESAGDVVGLVQFARNAGLRIAPQATGHNAGAIASLDDTILMKTERMRGVQVDPIAKIARVEAGVTWGEVTAAVSEHGLAALAGSSHDVGVIGYTLGGGLSFLARKHGLAANSVTAIELVTADGEFRRVDADSDPDLFWALRGGGGSFGAVTAIEIRLYDYATVYAGMLAFPWERSAEVLHAWRELAPTLPDEMTTVGRILQFPPIPDLPDFLRGRQLVVVEAVYLGDEADGAELLRPLVELGAEIDTLATIPAAGLQMLHMDPPEPVPGASDYAMLDDLPADALDTLIELAGPGSDSPLLSVELRQLGGAVARPQDGHGARGTFPGRYLMFAVGMAMSPDMKAAVEAHASRLAAALSDHHSASGYLNFAEAPMDAAGLYDDHSYARLREVKAAYDAGDLFRSNHPIPPAR
jgi:FAD/FMN-containing dehydrogenase